MSIFVSLPDSIVQRLSLAAYRYEKPLEEILMNSVLSGLSTLYPIYDMSMSPPEPKPVSEDSLDKFNATVSQVMSDVGDQIESMTQNYSEDEVPSSLGDLMVTMDGTFEL